MSMEEDLSRFGLKLVEQKKLDEKKKKRKRIEIEESKEKKKKKINEFITFSLSGDLSLLRRWPFFHHLRFLNKHLRGGS